MKNFIRKQGLLCISFFVGLVMINKIDVHAQIINTIAGGGTGTLAGVQATQVALGYPNYLCTDANGNIYFSDLTQQFVYKINTNGIISLFAGNGQNTFGGDGGPANQAYIYNPSGVVCDALGNVYFSDTGQDRIRKVNSSGIISTYAGTGTGGFSGDGGQANVAKIDAPLGLAIDGSGNLYFADQANNRIRKITSSGVISTFAGNGTNGYSGDGGPATAAALSGPCGVAVDASGNVYFSEISNNVIRKVSTNGIISTVAGTGQSGYSGDNGPATQAKLWQPQQVSCDASGQIYFADAYNARIRKINNAGVITTAAGNGTGGFSGDGGLATAAALGAAVGVWVHADGMVYICDSGNGRLRKFCTTATVSVAAGAPSICAGGTVALTAQGGNGTYTWSTAQSGSVIVNQPSVNTIYTVISGCSKATVSIQVNPVPNLSIVVNASITCIGEIQNLSVTGANSYTWSNSVTTATNAVVITSHSMQLSVLGTNSHSCVSSTGIVLLAALCEGIMDNKMQPDKDFYVLYKQDALIIPEKYYYNQQAVISVLELTGKLVMQGNIEDNSLKNTYLTNGIYLVRYQNQISGEIKQCKLTVFE